jgi:tetratricopeptide (TPR) repeat protein
LFSLIKQGINTKNLSEYPKNILALVLNVMLKDSILDLLSSNKLSTLFIVGKIGKGTSIELMRIVKSIDDDPESIDLFFAFHHSFQNAGNYFSEIVQDLGQQYTSNKEEIDPVGSLAPLFQNYGYINNQYASNSFLIFLRQLSLGLKELCRNIVFLLDPETIADPQSFNADLNSMLQRLPKNIKLIIFEDTESEKHARTLKERTDVRQFRIPSSGEEIIEFMEREIAGNKDLSNSQRVDYVHTLGKVYAGQGKTEKALVKYDQALKWFRQNKMVKEECGVLVDIGLMYNMKNDSNTSVEYFQRAFDVSSKNDLFSMATFCNNQIAKIHVETDRIAEATSRYNMGLQLADKSKDISSKANYLSSIGDLQLKIGKTNDAIKYFEQALSIYKKQGNFYGEAKELTKLSKSYKMIGNVSEAKTCDEGSKRIQKEKGFALEVSQNTDKSK